MKTEQQIKDKITELKKEEKNLAKEVIKICNENKKTGQTNEFSLGRISLRRSGIHQELCTLKWVLMNKNSKVNIGRISHNKIMNDMKWDRIKMEKEYKNKK